MLKLHTRFLLINVYQRVCRIFLFCFDLELFSDIKKDLVSTHSLFKFLLITQDINKIKKSRARFPRHYSVKDVCKISAKSIKLYGSWSSSKFSNFQTKKKPGFLEIIEVCLVLGIGFCITSLVLPNHKEISP